MNVGRNQIHPEDAQIAPRAAPFWLVLYLLMLYTRPGAGSMNGLFLKMSIVVTHTF